MKRIYFILLFIFNLTAIHSQGTLVESLIGEWNYQGSEISQTFYPMNSWNKEQLYFSQDYRFRHALTSYYDKQLISQTIEGSWSLSNDSSTILLFYDNNRYVKNLQIKTIYKRFNIYFLNQNFLVESEQVGKLTALNRYGKSKSVNANFQDDFLARQAEIESKSIVLNTEKYYFIDKNDSIEKKYKNAIYTIVTDEITNTPFRRTIKTSNGRLIEIKEDRLIIQSRLNHIKTYHENAKSFSNLQLNKKSDAPLEIPEKNIKHLYPPVSSIGMEVSAYFTLAALASTIIATPIVAVTSSPQNQAKNTWITAGTGILGIGIGTGSFYLFRSFRVKFDKASKKNYVAPIYEKKQ